MFTVFQSQRMELLASQLVQQLGQRRHPELTLQPDTILIQHAGMTRWLKMQLAQHSGIAANLDCTFPAAFLWRAYQAVLADPALTDETRYAAPQLTWSITGLLPTLVARQPDNYAAVKQYLDQAMDDPQTRAGLHPGEEQLKRLQLSARLAGLYEQYLLYRGDWITRWEAGEEVTGIPGAHHWQGHLWQALSAHRARLPKPPGPNRVTIHQQFLARASALANWPDELPSQLSIFGISSLPPELLEALAVIGARDDVAVDLYLMNPCNHYWGDIVPEKAIARKSLKQLLADKDLSAEDDYLLYGNPLLASMGQEGKEFIDQLWEIPHLELHELEASAAPDDTNNITMLQFLQQEIHNLTLRGEMAPLAPEIQATSQGKLHVADTDHSIEVSSCYGAMREVEVLYDRVLNLLDEDASLTPRDILVMAPDIGYYAPFIEAVFNSSAEGQPGLPYNISDRSLQEESAIYLSFLKLLELPDSRFTASQVLDLATVPAIAARFDFDDAQSLATLTRWVTESGIRWGLDASFKQQEWQLAGINNHSWAFGLDRMLLGYAMESDQGLFDDILPYSNLSGSDGQLLGQLISFINRLAELHKTLKIPRKLAAWQILLNRLIRDFYQQDPDTALEFRQIQQTIDQLVQLGEDNNVDEAFHYQVISYWMTRQLQQPAGGHGFLSRGITFCNLVAMRTIPARVVCLIGMNDDDFPRNRNPPGFDLLALPQLRRRGDRSHRQDDRYMFLEALLAARQHLYISYIGRNNQDDKERETSVLVNELLDYCDRAFVIEGNTAARPARERLVTGYPLQPFSPRYFAADTGDPLYTFSRQWWSGVLDATDSAKSLYAQLGNHPLPGLPVDDASDDGDESDKIELDDLLSFFRNPARFFFNRCLTINFPGLDDDIRDEEPFSLDGLDAYALMDEQLQQQPLDLDHWIERQQAAGTVLPGDAGRRQLLTQASKVAPLLARLEEIEKAFPPPVAVDVAIETESFRLQGHIRGLYGDRLFQYRAADLKPSDRLSAWIRLVALQADPAFSDQDLSMAVLGKNGKGQAYRIDADAAREQLASLIRLYRLGQRQPLFFMPATSSAWQSALRKQGDEGEAMTAAIKAWHPGDYARGDVDDVYLARCFDIPTDISADFKAVAADVFDPLLNHEQSFPGKQAL